MTVRDNTPYYLSRRFILVLLAVIVQFVVFLAWVAPFDLPRPNAWQTGAFLLFFGSFL